jgi:DNA-binding response OmpR family regulator
MYTGEVYRMKKILIADDEPHILELLKMMFEGQYRIFVAEDGKETLEILSNMTPDLILLDVMMPKINGFEICEKLKKDPKTRGITIALLSAKTQERDIMKGLKLGADYYFTKPFDPAYLEKEISKILENGKPEPESN